MKKKTTVAAVLAVLLFMTGCQSDSGNAETEALKEQISQLEQQIAVLQQQNTETDNNTQAQADSGTQGQSVPPTTRTMEELTAMVNAYIEKANAAAPNGTASDNMEQFFSLKQEEKQIDAALDLHEDELENLYRQNALTRDEYKSLERELEKLEDSLDRAEDRLEYTFGIDD